MISEDVKEKISVFSMMMGLPLALISPLANTSTPSYFRNPLVRRAPLVVANLTTLLPFYRLNLSRDPSGKIPVIEKKKNIGLMEDQLGWYYITSATFAFSEGLLHKTFLTKYPTLGLMGPKSLYRYEVASKFLQGAVVGVNSIPWLLMVTLIRG